MVAVRQKGLSAAQQLVLWGGRCLFCSQSVRMSVCMRVCGLYVGDLYAVSAIRWHGKRDRKHKREKQATTSDKMLLGFCQRSPCLCQMRCLSFGSDAESIRKESRQNADTKRVNVNNILIHINTYPTQVLIYGQSGQTSRSTSPASVMPKMPVMGHMEPFTCTLWSCQS